MTKIRREKKTGIDYVVFLATSQAQVARDLGITRQAVQRWVENGYAPDDWIDALVKKYGVTPESLRKKGDDK